MQHLNRKIKHLAVDVVESKPFDIVTTILTIIICASILGIGAIWHASASTNPPTPPAPVQTVSPVVEMSGTFDIWA